MASTSARRRVRGNSFVAVLDTCVLAPMPVADTLLRLAEEPCFYLPRWSPHILDELRRTLIGKFGYTDQQADRRLNVMRDFFPEALVGDYEDLIPSMKNHPGTHTFLRPRYGVLLTRLSPTISE